MCKHTNVDIYPQHAGGKKNKQKINRWYFRNIDTDMSPKRKTVMF